jgi:N-methylhydantoinase A
MTDTPVYAGGASIAAGCRIDGPAIIEEATTTIVLDPGASAQVGDTGYFISVGRDEANVPESQEVNIHA